MTTRKTVLKHAVEECIKELYSLAQPHIDWKEFKKECKNYSNRFETWEIFRRAQIKKNEFPQEWAHQKRVHPNWENNTITECIGPRPFEYYYLPEKVKDIIVEGYVDAYKLDSQQELLDTIEILKNYCKEPIVDKWFDDYDDEYGHHPGYRGFEYADNLEKEVYRIAYDIIHPISGIGTHFNFEAISKQTCNKFFEFLDKAGNFFNWNSELNFFNTNVYLGSSPSSNKQEVIDNWKIYRKTNIEIDDSEYDEYDEE